MAFARSVDDQQPIIDLNTTPLIDVMLVLLIMFIITIPIQTHAVKLDLPSCKDCPIVDALKNELAITREGVLLWNRTPVTEAQLRYNLAASVRMPKQPELHLRPDPESRYEVVDQVLADIKEEKVTKVGFVGNEDYHW